MFDPFKYLRMSKILICDEQRSGSCNFLLISEEMTASTRTVDNLTQNQLLYKKTCNEVYAKITDSQSDVLQKLGSKVLPHPSYSPDFIPSDGFLKRAV